MPDKVQLRFGKNAADTAVEHFISYRIDADLYTAADAFHMEFANPNIKITAGMRCELLINDRLELTGVVDRTHRRVNKNGVSLAVEGRDLMGLLVDSHCEKLMSVVGKKLDELAEILLEKVPFINRKDIKYQANVAGRLKKKAIKKGGSLFFLDEPQKISQIEAGMTVFQVLKQVAMSRGMIFYSLPDGTFVFGRPMVSGEPSYSIQIKKDGIGNNVIEAEYIDDISKRFSRVIIKGQRQGRDSDGMFPKKKNTGDFADDNEFPFYKPFMTRNNNDSMSPKMLARHIIEKQRRDGMRLTYKVARHSQNGKNWTINEFCQVEDEINDLKRPYLIYGRTFELSKSSGPTTTVKLGPPGRTE
jgi:prophage tail gpP-like protein